MINFFKKEEEQRIIAAIREAESQTSGEIRVHLEKDFKGKVEDAATKTFARLRMDRTADNNGVLIFIVPSKKQFAIIGGKGIHEKVPPNFWQDVRDVMQHHFRDGNYTEGVCQGVLLAGQKLKEHFPWQSDDENELPDEISYG
ncbi:MAG: TPM domain-containing protein [Saprospiraceae bacterium]|nr:MAG: TPM domain-containing protein [Saprospiraceae bacterium]